jgi:hypothetical protein
MQRSDGQSQPRRTGGRKTGEMDTTGAINNPARHLSTMDDDFDFGDDDERATGNPRSNSSVIRRRSNLGPVARTTTTGVQAAPPANRRAQQYPTMQQPSAAKPLLSPQPPQKFRNPRRPPLDESQDHKRRVHWLLFVGVGMIAMLGVWVIGSSLLAWGSFEYNNIVYGTPRTYQTDAVVGHGGDSPQHPSHFIAINLNRQAIVIELMAGNPAESIDYVVPYYILGPGGDLTPVTVSFRDVTGNGKLDMLVDIHLSPQDQIFPFINNGTKFRAPGPNDHIHL